MRFQHGIPVLPTQGRGMFGKGMENSAAEHSLALIFCDAKSRCRRGLHRLRCGGSTPPSCSLGLQALQRSLSERCKLQGDRLQVVVVRCVLLQTCNLQPVTPIETACGLPRTAERPVSETVSLGGAIPLTPTIFQPLQVRIFSSLIWPNLQDDFWQPRTVR